MEAAADARPWERRRKEAFWSGAFTNVQRKVMAESPVVRESDLADIRMMSWEVDPDAFRENFVSFAEHCNYR